MTVMFFSRFGNQATKGRPPRWEPLASYVSEAVEANIPIENDGSYEDFKTALLAGKYDLANAGPLAAIRSGEIDVIFERISPEQIELLDAQDPIDVIQGPEFTTQMINFDVTRAPFDDIAVRQAIEATEQEIMPGEGPLMGMEFQ